MEGMVRTVRLLLGLAMVAAGTTLVAPAAIQAHGQWQRAQPTGSSGPVPAATMPVPAPAVAFPAAAAATLPEAPQPGPVAINREYVLPNPPVPLPPVAAPPLSAEAGLATAYRSTLDVPPPPLLDGQQPPPLAPAWTGRDAERRPPAVPSPVARQAAVYVIRDGDDLTRIATRVYGHPAAASAIWQANRGLLSDPGILPIGAAILLPHPDTIAGLTPTGPRPASIEPAHGPGNVRAVGQSWP
jgi:phage tail protein X